LTINRLGITGTLARTLESTNPVESMIEIIRDHARRVKRYSSGEMALGRRRHAGRPCSVPPRQGLPAARPARPRPGAGHRRGARPRGGWRHRPDGRTGLLAGGAAHRRCQRPLPEPRAARLCRRTTWRGHAGCLGTNPRCRRLRTPHRAQRHAPGEETSRLCCVSSEVVRAYRLRP
jgi:hypothetical protein